MKPVVKPSILDNYKDIIIDKIDNFGATGKAVYYFIKKKGYPPLVDFHHRLTACPSYE